MKETSLWNHLRPLLNRHGKFQKISDRFTSGIPDILGVANGVGYAIELKELEGVGTVKASYRPGQLDWLAEWESAGGVSWVAATRGLDGWLFPARMAGLLGSGVPHTELHLIGTKFSGGKGRWESMAKEILK